MLKGALFTRDFLLEGIKDLPAWRALSDADAGGLRERLRATLLPFAAKKAEGEAVTEQQLIYPVLDALGWQYRLPQQRTDTKGRESVPDLLLLASAEDLQTALALKHPADRWKHALSGLEAKGWQRVLDRTQAAAGEVPAEQMLRYLSRIDVLSDRKARWAILTNGRLWRLYFNEARSRSEEFFEIDLAAALELPGIQLQLDDPRATPDLALRLFILLFRRTAFQPQDDGRTLHRLALDEGRDWEARVADDLSKVVFGQVFPGLIRAIAANDPARPTSPDERYLREVRDDALTLLYRLLFVLYAEDRNLLPRRHPAYRHYSLDRLREEIVGRLAGGSAFSPKRHQLFNALTELFETISKGDTSLGLPPYNGGLFESDRAPALARAGLPDTELAPLLRALSHREVTGEWKRINYRDLSVRQLGSIYERLLEYQPYVTADGSLDVRLQPFARKGSGSYYTPDDLVRLIIERTLRPLVDERREAFRQKCQELQSATRRKEERAADLAPLDPGGRLLDLRVLDPAMGSGHFLVDLVDWLADEIQEALDEATKDAAFCGYVSPLRARIASIRERIDGEATKEGWSVDPEQLDDRQIIRRMILKRVVFGVDKNPMAVELAKVSLWLHTFTVGAPLSFLDHHLRCGDSLFGEWVRPVMDQVDRRYGLVINRYVAQARGAAQAMAHIEAMSDADIAEARDSAQSFAGIEDATRPLRAFLDFWHALRWLKPTRQDYEQLKPFFDGAFGPPIAILEGRSQPVPPNGPEQQNLLGEEPDAQSSLLKQQKVFRDSYERTVSLLAQASELAHEQRFLHWQAAFPGVWDNWDSNDLVGGFDAVIGNPPWDRIKFQRVEWFASRRPDIALAQTAAQSQQMIDQLVASHDPLAAEYELAVARADTASEIARSSGEYPMLSRGDINIYSLFVERSHRLLGPTGLVGLLVPSGIASDLGSSLFFSMIMKTRRLASLVDFFNKRDNDELFFSSVYYRFKFCLYVGGGTLRAFDKCEFAFFVQNPMKIGSKSVRLDTKIIAQMNPNSGTSPIFRHERDAVLATQVYEHLPVLANHSGSVPVEVWPVRYLRMFDMTNDSNHFKPRAQLEAEGFYPTKQNRLRKGDREFAPLYEGKLVQSFDHRAASVVVDAERLHRPGHSVAATLKQHQDPYWFPEPQFWVDRSLIDLPEAIGWSIGFKDVTSTTNSRTMIAAALPRAASGNTLPLLVPGVNCLSDETEDNLSNSQFSKTYKHWAPLLLANLNSMPLDYFARQKVQGNHLNWYIVEQLPIVQHSLYIKKIGGHHIQDLVCSEVLRLTYTAWDMQSFASEMGHDGPPFEWDEEDRLHRRARLDALFFLLYEITDEDDIRYILDTFPIVRRQDEAQFGRYRTCDLIIAYLRAFKTGDVETRVAA